MKNALALSWLEAMLLVLLVILGLGLWEAARTVVEEDPPLPIPNEARIRLDHGVAAQEALLTQATQELAALQAKASDLSRQWSKEKAALGALSQNHPELAPWLASPPPSVRIDIAQNFAQLNFDLSTARAQADRLRAQVGRLSEERAVLKAVQPNLSLGTKDQALNEAEVTLLETSLTAITKQLAETFPEISRLEALLQILSVLYPDVEALTKNAPRLHTVPAETIELLKTKPSAAHDPQVAFERSISELKTKVHDRTCALLATQEKASQEWKQAQQKWAEDKQLAILVKTSLWTGLAYLVLILFTSALSSLTNLRFRGIVVWGGSILLLAVTYTYETYGVAPAAFVALIFLPLLVAVGSGGKPRPATPPVQPAA